MSKTQTNSFSEFEQALMRRLIDEASKYQGLTGSNPLVAAAVYNHQEIISIGAHKRMGGDHAEVDALKQAGDQANGASMMVTLEPCTHYGKTPPCAEAIIKAGIKHVIYACSDPFSEVKENPARRRLEAEGISVRSQLLNDEARALNRYYFYAHEHKRPFILLKVATSLDGYIGLSNGDSKYLSCKASLTRVHELRSELSAVMIGRETLEIDNPSCTVRHVPLKEGQPQPACIVVGRRSEISKGLALFLTDATSIYATTQSNSTMQHDFDELWPIFGDDAEIDWQLFFDKCYEANIYSIMLEGGSALISMALKAGIVNEGLFFITPRLIGANQGKPLCDIPAVQALADISTLDFSSAETIGDDILVRANFDSDI